MSVMSGKCRLLLGALFLQLILVPGSFLCAGPVHHVVLFQFKKETGQSDILSVTREFSRLARKISGIRSFQWGINNSPEGFNKDLTHGFIMTFENLNARDAYLPHLAHRKFIQFALPMVEQVFVNDFEVEQSVSPAEPGRTHHLVFFKFKESATEQEIDKVVVAFGDLRGKIPGLLHFQAGPDRTPADSRKGWHGFWLTFTNERARNDYLPHPAHREFGKLVGPVLEEPLVFDFTVRPSSRSLFVTRGLEPYRVYQRSPDDVADLEFGGVCAEDGPIESRLLQGRRTLAGFDWKMVGESSGGVFEAKLEGVPAGGEYTVEVRRRDVLGNVAAHTEVANILVGDLWILAGQSNMQGVGNLREVEEPHPLVHCFTIGHRWEVAREPLHWLIDSPDVVHSSRFLAKAKSEDARRELRARERQRRRKGAGLGLPFARELVRRTGIPVGLIASAHGGTSMKQWDPAGRDRGGETLYGSMCKQVKNVGGRVRGVLWYQGESDANPAGVLEFAGRFEELVKAFRRDFQDDKLPFYYVQIGRFVREAPSDSWDQIQELQRQAESKIPAVAMISVIDLSLDDLIHVDTEGLKRAGKRLARIAHRELFGETGLERGPRPIGARATSDGRALRVTFQGGNGGLLPATSIKGFSVHQEDGTRMRMIYKASVDPADRLTVILQLSRPIGENSYLWYGKGLDPVCNLVDEQDMAAPVFGPMKIER